MATLLSWPASLDYVILKLDMMKKYVRKYFEFDLDTQKMMIKELFF